MSVSWCGASPESPLVDEALVCSKRPGHHGHHGNGPFLWPANSLEATPSLEAVALAINTLVACRDWIDADPSPLRFPVVDGIDRALAALRGGQ